MRKYNILQLALGVALLLPIIAVELDCSTDDDCPFLGTCNEATKKCVCQIDCSAYRPLPGEQTAYYCTSHQMWPLTQCKALSRACESRTNLLMKAYNPIEFTAFGRDCKNLPYTGGEELCEDQSFCKGNGICYRSTDNSNAMFCRCNRYYDGERCGIRSLEQVGDNVITGVGSGNQQPSKGSQSMLGRIAPYLAFGVLSAVLGCCFVSQYVKRRNNQKGSKNDQSADSQLNQVVVTTNDKQDQVVSPSNRPTDTMEYKAPVPVVVECQIPAGKPGARRARL